MTKKDRQSILDAFEAQSEKMREDTRRALGALRTELLGKFVNMQQQIDDLVATTNAGFTETQRQIAVLCHVLNVDGFKITQDFF